MKIGQNPQLLDHLACSYALGTLRGGARRRFEAIARESPKVRAAALVWQEQLSGLTELQAPVQPSPNVWKRISNLLDAQRVEGQASAQATEHGIRLSDMLARVRARLRRWQGGAIAAGLASAAALGVAVHFNALYATSSTLLAQSAGDLRAATAKSAAMAAQLQAAPNIQYVAVLADDKASPSMLVTLDTQNQRLVLKRVGGYQEAPDRSLQLWALPPGTLQAGFSAPRSLGVLGTEQVIRLVAERAQLEQAPALAISLEPLGGVPSARGPTGPVLFKGALLQTAL